MTDFIASIIDDGRFSGTEYFSKRIVAGDVERARAGLVYALEKLNYQIISREPLMAKNNASSSAGRGKLVEALHKYSKTIA